MPSRGGRAGVRERKREPRDGYPDDSGGDGEDRPRKGTPNVELDEPEFRRRFLAQFQDRAFDPLTGELDRIVSAAWEAYSHHRKSPRTRKAGEGFHDPDYDISVDWLAARAAIAAARLATTIRRDRRAFS